jgi:hypothetical protein
VQPAGSWQSLYHKPWAPSLLASGCRLWAHKSPDFSAMMITVWVMHCICRQFHVLKSWHRVQKTLKDSAVSEGSSTMSSGHGHRTICQSADRLCRWLLTI